MSNTSTHRGHVVQRVLEWLRAGYPQGIPKEDYYPLLGLLHRKLTEPEVELVAQTLVTDGKIDASPEDITDAVRKVVHETPDEDDIKRVRSRLAQGGWPLADPGELSGMPDSETA